MFTLDLPRLDAELRSPKAACRLQALLGALEVCPGPYCQDRLRATPWQALVIRTRECGRIHRATRERLESGDPADGASLRRGFELGELDASDRSLRALLSGIRTDALGLDDVLRSGPCRAEAGFTRKVALFPDAAALPGALGVLGEFREAEPLAHPVWNALLLYLLLLRVHPYGDGNGRTMRVLLAFELRRAGLVGDSVLPLKRVIDANRATEMKLYTDVSRVQRDPLRGTRAFARALSFMAQVVELAARHASAQVEASTRAGDATAAGALPG